MHLLSGPAGPYSHPGRAVVDRQRPGTLRKAPQSMLTPGERACFPARGWREEEGIG